MAKYEPRTKPTTVSPAKFIDAIENETLRRDSKAIVKLMKAVTGESPYMWGPTIVGFGTYHYKYASGHEGDAPLAGFSPRRPKLVIYIMPGFPRYEALMARLGKYTSGKVCVYIKSLDDIDMKVLEELVTGSVAQVKKLYPGSGREAMPTTDPRVDAYIVKSAPFAQPILKHLRKLVHQACPDVEETLKWGMPSFTYHGNLCGFAAFKNHATFGFWKYALLVDEEGSPGRATAEKAMGMFGRLTSRKDLPSDRVMLGLIRKAMALNEQGIKVPKAQPKHPKPVTRMPPAPSAALKRNRKAGK